MTLEGQVESSPPTSSLWENIQCTMQFDISALWGEAAFRLDSPARCQPLLSHLSSRLSLLLSLASSLLSHSLYLPLAFSLSLSHSLSLSALRVDCFSFEPSAEQP